MAEVISIGKLDEGQLQDLAQAGVEVQEGVDLGELGLQELQNGERFMFHLDPMETAIYVEMHRAYLRVEKWNRQMVGKSFAMLGECISNSAPDKDIEQALDNQSPPALFENEEAEEKYWRLVKRFQFLNSLLYWRIGERSNCHHWHLLVRAPAPGDKQLRAVRVSRRVSPGEEQAS